MMQIQKLRPLPLMLIVACMVLIGLLIRGLNIAPLHTDVFVMRGWFEQFGREGFADYYFAINQRHPLVGSIYTFTYSVFGNQDIYYTLFYQIGRLLNGVLLGGVIMLLSQRRVFAVCVGLALMFTPIRLAESYQQLYWLIELTLTLLLLSLYCYIYSFKSSHRLLWYTVSFAIYVISVLIYESGLPWLGVIGFVGLMIRADQPWPKRLLYSLRDTLPFLACAIAVMIAVLFIWDPWAVLAPSQNASAGILERFALQFGTVFQFPSLYLKNLMVIGADGYYRWMAVFGVLSATLIGFMAWAWARPDQDQKTSITSENTSWVMLIAFGFVLLLASILVGSAASAPTFSYLDRTTFGRTTGITLIYVTLIFAVCDIIRSRWKTVIASAIVGLALIGPGIVFLFAYQTYAQQAAHEVERITDALIEIRWQMTAPVHLIVIAPENWVAARFTDTVDLTIHEIQQLIWERGLAATIDFLHTGAYPAEYAVEPGTCHSVAVEGSSGICVDSEKIYNSRWAWSLGMYSRLEDLVLLRYDATAGTLSIIGDIRADELRGYNFITANIPVVSTNRERLTIELP